MPEHNGERSRTSTTNDAYWEVPYTDYVPFGVAPDHSVLDDPDHLDSAWHATLETLKREADESQARRDEIARKAEEINKSIRERAEQRRQQHSATDGLQTATATSRRHTARTATASPVARLLGRLVLQRG